MMKCKILAIFLSLFLLAGQYPSHPSLSQGQAQQRQAIAAYENGDIESAIKHFEAALSIRPAHPGIIFNLALLNSEADKGDAALNYLELYADMGLVTRLDREEFALIVDQAPFGQRFDAVVHKMTANNTPLGRATLAFETEAAIPLSEGIAYDPERGDFFISSIYERKIMRVKPTGEMQVFVENLDASPMALWLDPKAKLLWAATTILQQSQGQFEAHEKKTGLMAFSLYGDEVHHFSSYPEFFAGEDIELSFGDVMVADNGDVFIANSLGQDIFRLRYGEKLKLDFFQIENTASLQGMAMVNDDILLVADYSTGLHSLNVETGEGVWLGQPDGVSLLGIDGLSSYNGKLIAIQNGVRPYRILEISLSDDFSAVTEVKVLEQAHADFSEPTNGVVVGDKFYFIANSGWENFANPENITPEMLDNLTPTKVMAINLADH